MEPDEPAAIDFPGPFAWPAETSVGWADFFRRWDPQAATVCRNFRLQTADRDDVMQQVRGTVVRKRAENASFDTNARFAAFLRKTAQGFCKKVLERHRHRPTLDVPSEIPDLPETSEFADPFPPGLPAENRFEWLVGHADEADRDVLRLRLIDRLEFAEIAARLGCVTSTAYARYTRALIRLRRRFTHDAE